MGCTIGNLNLGNQGLSEDHVVHSPSLLCTSNMTSPWGLINQFVYLFVCFLPSTGTAFGCGTEQSTFGRVRPKLDYTKEKNTNYKRLINCSLTHGPK